MNDRFLDCPRVMIAGTGSGTGKTSVTLGLIRALVRRGLRVQPFKVGPDYLDPFYLARAAGRRCFNVDTWMCGAPYVRMLVSTAAKGCDIIVVEGAMGLFDGAAPDSMKGSSAEIARLLDLPVMLVCDARGQARSLAATVKGFAEFEPGVTVEGVIANYCGSRGHVELLARALEAACLPPLVGGIEKGSLPTLESRHLGLCVADASARTEHTVAALSEAVSAQVSVDRLLDIAGRAEPSRPHTSARAPAPRQNGLETRDRLRLGLAEDAAFCFYYPDNLDAFEAHGFSLVPFSPLADAALPDALDALYIGGGYPELFAEALSANTSMLSALRAFCLSGRPVYAECGGLMYLSEGIIAQGGARHEMLGVLPVTCRMLDRIATLGYAEVVFLDDCLWGPSGTTVRGHEFHYSDLVSSPEDGSPWHTVYNVFHRRGGTPSLEGYRKGNILASYVHLHLASHPACIAHFQEVCRNAKRAHQEPGNKSRLSSKDDGG